jgi:hypothetical protein
MNELNKELELDPKMSDTDKYTVLAARYRYEYLTE